MVLDTVHIFDFKYPLPPTSKSLRVIIFIIARTSADTKKPTNVGFFGFFFRICNESELIPHDVGPLRNKQRRVPKEPPIRRRST